MAITFPAVTTQLTATGGLTFCFCRDNRGSAFTSEVTIATGVDAYSCGGAWLGNQFIALYSKAGQVYSKTSANPDDWSGAAETAITGITGRVYGLALNDAGVLCALVDKTPVVSRDRGLTWTASAALTISVPAFILAVRHMFVVVYPTNTGLTQMISVDGGLTFA